MNIKYVTLTGADDSVSPVKLVTLSKKYPFVEWGILFSTSRIGTSRYPSLEWIDELVSFAKANSMNLSAHFCGAFVRQALNGHISFLEGDRFSKFQRVQFNLGSKGLSEALSNETFINAQKSIDKTVILGGNYEDAKIDTNFLLSNLICPLFDASGGNGLESKEFPEPFKCRKGFSVTQGYAGGIGPENIISKAFEIKKVIETNAPIWIDMESKIRADDKFDLDKCEDVLSQISYWVDV